MTADLYSALAVSGISEEAVWVHHVRVAVDLTCDELTRLASWSVDSLRCSSCLSMSDLL